MALYSWSQIEWTMAIDVMEAQGVDIEAIPDRWGASTNPQECAAPGDPADHGWADDDVILTEERHRWVCGVLAGELAPSPIPD
jgi:hypothetical protein